MTRTWIALVLATLGCKGKDAPAAQPAAPMGSGSAVVALDAPPAPVPVPVDASVDTSITSTAMRCGSPCLFLVDTPLDKVVSDKLVEAACAGASLFADGDCEQHLYALNCIYAAHGKVFKTPAWKDRFTGLAWYQPKPAFTDDQLTGVALANVRALKEQQKACKASMLAVEPADIAIASAFVNEIATSSSDDQLPEFARGLDLRNKHTSSSTTYTHARPPKDGQRFVIVKGLFHAVGPGENLPDEQITVVIEADKVVGVD